MKLSEKTVFRCMIWLIIATHALALAAILFAAATARAHAALPTPSARTEQNEPCESPARPECNSEPTAPFGVPSAPICNPATAGSRLSSGPGSSSVFYPVKQHGVPNLAPTLPAVAG